MAIKWNDIIVSTTGITNHIILGKLNKQGNMWTDKSEDKTKEVIFAVAEHMARNIKADKNEASYEVKLSGRLYHLTLKNLGNITEEV